MIVDWVQWREGAGPSVLFDQHNEHRLGLARLVFFADYGFAQGSGALNIAVIWALQALHVWVLWGVFPGKRHQGPDWLRDRRVALVVVSGLIVLLFSARQFENLLWGFQVQFVGVYLLATLSVWALATGLLEADGRRRAKVRWMPFAGAMIGAAVAATTMASGLFVWLLLVVASMLWRAPLGAVLALVAGSATVWGLYLADYSSPGHHGNPLESLLRPDQLVAYVVMYLGAPFVPKKVVGWIPGIPLLVGMGAVLILSATRWRTHLTRNEWVFAGVIAFVLGAAFLTALGRIEIGVGQSSASRYTTPVHLGVAALLLLALGRFQEIQARVGRRALLGSGVFLALMGLFVLVNHAIYLEKRAGPHRGLALAQSALIAGVRDMEAYRGAHPDPNVVADRAALYREAALAPFHDGRAARVGRMAPAEWRTPAGACDGQMLVKTPVPDDPSGRRIVVSVADPGSGWLLLNPDRVLWIVDDEGFVGGVAFPSRKPSAAELEAIGGDLFEGHLRRRAGETGPVAGWMVLEEDDALLCVTRLESRP